MDSSPFKEDDDETLQPRVYAYLETALNQYFESNNLSRDESVSSSSSSVSILASPLLSDYVSSHVWSSEKISICSPSLGKCIEEEEEEEEGEDLLANSLSSLQITTSEEDEHSVALRAIAVEEDSVPTSSFCVADPRGAVLLQMDTDDQKNQQNVQGSSLLLGDSIRIPSSYLHTSSPKHFGMGESPINRVETHSNDSWISRSSSSVNVASFVRREETHDHQSFNSNILSQDNDSQSLSKENATSTSSIERHVSNRVQVDSITSSTPSSSSSQSKQTTPTMNLVETMTSPSFLLEKIAVEFSRSDKTCHEWKSPIVHSIHPIVHSASSVQMEEEEGKIKQSHEQEDEFVEDSPFHRYRIDQLSSYHSVSTTPFKIDQTIDPMEIITSPAWSEYSSSIQSSIGSTVKTNESSNWTPYELSVLSESSTVEDYLLSPSNINNNSKDCSDTKYTPVDPKRDSYLSLSHDLSSTKKHLNAHSSSFMKQLKGAFQRRTLNLAQSQNNTVSTTGENSQPWGVDTTSHSSTKKVTFSQDCKASSLQSKDMKLDENNVFMEKSKADKPDIHHRRALSSSSANVVLGRSNDPDFDFTPFKARPLPASTMDSTGQSGVPKVSKRPITIPISPQLGLRRRQISNPSGGKKHDTNVTHTSGPSNHSIVQCIPNHYKSPGPSTQSKRRETPNTLNYDTPSKDLHGLEFLGPTPHATHRHPQVIDVNLQNTYQTRTNSQSSTEYQYPFTLHSALRAKNRQDFEKWRLENELNVRKRRMAVLESIIKSKQAELETLKPQL